MIDASMWSAASRLPLADKVRAAIAEVLAVLGANERPNLAAPWVCRHEQWITIDGHRGVPLAATVPSGPLATAGVDER